MMRFLILVLAISFSFSGFTSTAEAGSGFEGTYKVTGITENTGPWSQFWIRPKVTQLAEITLEETANNLYIGLKDVAGMTWSANYGVCEGEPGPHCNAFISADGKTLSLQFWGDMTWFKISLSQDHGRFVWESDNGPAVLSFAVVKK